MGIGASGVVDYANTTSSIVTGVVAVGGIGGIGVVAETIPPSGSYIMTQNNDYLTDELSNKLITE